MEDDDESGVGDHGERKTEWKVGWIVQATDRRIDAVMRKREVGRWRVIDVGRCIRGA